MKLKINYLIITGLLVVFFVFLSPFIFSHSLPYDTDVAYYISAYEITIDKGGNPTTSDFLIQQNIGFILNRTYGVYGVPAGYLILFGGGFNIYYPFILITSFVILLSFLFYYLYDDGKKSIISVIVFAFSLFSARLLITIFWGQWGFLTSSLFIVLSIIFYKKFLEKGGLNNGIFVFLSLFTLIQVHQMGFLVACSGIASLIINKLLNKEFTLNKIKLTIIIFVLLFVSQLFFLKQYRELFSTYTGRNFEFSIIDAFYVKETFGYHESFFNNYLAIWSLNLFLMPFGVYYAFKKKNYTFLIWFIFTFVLSRPTLLSITGIQLRISIITPLIGAMLSADGLKQLINWFNKKNLKKIITISLIVTFVGNYYINIFSKPMTLNEDVVDVLLWCRDNIDNAIIITTFNMNWKEGWWCTTLAKNKVFVARFENNSILTSGYEDLSGVYNATHLIMTSNLYSMVPSQNVLYNNNQFMVISV